MSDRTALVTGASGYVGDKLVPALLDAGWSVRVLARTPDKLDDAWRDRVEVVEGDLSESADVRTALDGVRVAYYLVHSMEGSVDFRERDRQLAHVFADAARDADVARIVYLSGLHPADKGPDELSDHMASRVEVGEILLASGVPTAVLQAGVVLGDGSASFDMLRHLTERLPIAPGPRFLRNLIQPIHVDDAVYYLVKAADLDPSVNRTIDIGMDETLSYLDMMGRYAKVAGLGPRLLTTVPLLTPGIASYWVGFVTPVDASVARPLVGSLTHDATKDDDAARELMGEPEGGVTGYDDAIRKSLETVDPKRWRRTLAGVGAGVVSAAVAGSVLTKPDGRWYRSLRKPAWQPPGAAFPIVWTALYAIITATGAATIAELEEKGEQEDADQFKAALGANLGLNAAWSGLFFRSRSLPLATAEAAVLAASSADLARRAAPLGVGRAAGLGAYAAWCAFATALSAQVWRLNRTR